MTTTLIAETTHADLVVIVAAELAELRAAGVPIAIDARRLVELEAAGFVVDLVTGEIVEPFLPLGERP